MPIKPEEIEGSQERAADRGQPMGLENLPPDDSSPWLGNPEDVAGLVRGLVGHFIAVRTSWLKGDLDHNASMAQCKAEVDKVEAIVLGRDPLWSPSAWNSPEQVGQHIKDAMELPEPNTKTVDRLLWHVGVTALSASEALAAGAIDEETAIFRIEAEIENASRLISGLPASNEFDDPAPQI